MGSQRTEFLASRAKSDTLARMNTKLFVCVVFFCFAFGAFAEPKLKPIFNGKDLTGWKAPKGNDAAGWYKAVDGVLKVQSGPKKKGSILWTRKKYRNFVMEFDFRFGEGVVDSGVHVRNQDQIIHKKFWHAFSWGTLLCLVRP